PGFAERSWLRVLFRPGSWRRGRRRLSCDAAGSQSSEWLPRFARQGRGPSPLPFGSTTPSAAASIRVVGQFLPPVEPALLPLRRKCHPTRGEDPELAGLPRELH